MRTLPDIRRTAGHDAGPIFERHRAQGNWHLLASPEARYTDLGPDWHARNGDRDRKIRAHLRQLQALGLDVTLTPAA
jgi:hypothetical protein